MRFEAHLPIEQVFPNPKQPRKVFKQDTLLELAQTIKDNGGVIQPIIVEEESQNKFMLVAGERRLRASQLAGMKTIEAIIRDRSNHNGREVLLSAIVENVQREDMNPLDEATAYGELNTVHKMSAIKIAAKIGKNSKHVFDRLKLLKLEKKVQELIRDGQLSHDSRLVDALLNIPKAGMQVALAQRAASQKLKITTVMEASKRFCEAVEAKPIGIRKNQTPSLTLARRYKEDEEQEPNGWSALVQIGSTPAWPLVVLSAKTTCAKCELRDMANDSTCGRCPLVVMLEGLLENAQEAVQ